MTLYVFFVCITWQEVRESMRFRVSRYLKLNYGVMAKL